MVNPLFTAGLAKLGPNKVRGKATPHLRLQRLPPF
jgi:hypothetical protein